MQRGFARVVCVLAIGLSVSALFAPRGTLTLPLNCSYVSGAAVVESMTVIA